MASKLRELAARGLLIVSRLFYRVGRAVYPDVDLAYVRRTARLYDMVLHPDEDYYARQYLRLIMPALEAALPGRDAAVLDLACGQGRLSLPVARWMQGGRVVGVDFTPTAIEKASEYAAGQGVRNVEFAVSDIYDFLRGQPAASAGAVMCIEALYMVRRHREVVEETYRVLRPGGVAFLGFRPQHYNLLDAVRRRRFEDAKVVAHGEEGRLMGSPVWYSWHTAEQVSGSLRRLGFRSVTCHGIGPLSGIEGDPLEHIARPSLLTEAEREALFELEAGLDRQYADTSRYILAIAVK